MNIIVNIMNELIKSFIILLAIIYCLIILAASVFSICLFEYHKSSSHKKPKVEYILIKNRCTYHHSDLPGGTLCMNCGEPVDGKPGEYVDGYHMIISYPDGRKEGWTVDEKGK